MLEIMVPGKQEYWDEKKREFIHTNFKDTVLKLEHSLISISKWEAKWHIPFIESNKTDEQIFDYIRCMTLNPGVDDEVYNRLTMSNIKDIKDYISDPMTASSVRNIKKPTHSNEQITSELIYYWMIAYNIPVEFEKWHINRLIMLIRICAAKNQPPKKMSQREIHDRYRAINAANKAKYHTRG